VARSRLSLEAFYKIAGLLAISRRMMRLQKSRNKSYFRFSAMVILRRFYPCGQLGKIVINFVESNDVTPLEKDWSVWMRLEVFRRKAMKHDNDWDAA
jgi:hypothetical protein